MPTIPPTIAEAIKSSTVCESNVKLPAKNENTKNAKVIYKSPKNTPLTKPRDSPFTATAAPKPALITLINIVPIVAK